VHGDIRQGVCYQGDLLTDRQADNFDLGDVGGLDDPGGGVDDAHGSGLRPGLLPHLDRHLSDNAIELGLKQCQLEQAPLPAVLWRFGLISVEQLDQLWSWQALQEAPPEPA